MMMDKEKALSKCMHLCSGREYCVHDILEKLKKWDITQGDNDEIIACLIDQKFIDHQRYVTAFVNDKIKFNHWGKIKVNYYLKQKKIESALIHEALINFDEELYVDIAEQELNLKWNRTKTENVFEKKNKVAKSIIAKGFEPELVFKLLKEL